MIEKSADGLGTQLRRLLELLDGDLEEIYRRDGHGYRPRYTPVMKALADGQARAIKEIAALSSISHSAASQTVSKMTADGLVRAVAGADGRERLISLTRAGAGMLPLLKIRWDATQAAADALDDELPASLSATLAAAIDALDVRPFTIRVKTAERRLKKESA